MIRCMQCKNLDLRAVPAMSKLGFGICNIYSRGKYHGFSVRYLRECSMFSEIDKEKLEARQSYFDQQLKD